MKPSEKLGFFVSWSRHISTEEGIGMTENSTEAAVTAPRQLGDSHTLSFPRKGELGEVYGSGLRVPKERPLPDDFTD